MSYVIAVVGATGNVGREMLNILDERKFPASRVDAVASRRSQGREVSFGDRTLKCQALEHYDFSKADIALFAAGSGPAKEYAPKAAKAGCVVIDNSSLYRMDEDVPLIVPEVNPQAIADYKKRNIIANPNCSTIGMLVALKPLYDAVGIERINVATYQAVSGTGKAAIEELAGQTARLLNGKAPEPEVYPKQIAFNAIPHIDNFQDNGYTREEMKMVWETQKILGDPNILVNPTCVRVPVFYGHAEAVHIETREPISAERAREVLEGAAGVTLLDRQEAGGYPTPVTEAAGADPVFVGRVREDISHPRGLNLWVVADNVRKGAALNSVQIAEVLLSEYLQNVS